MNPIRKYHYFYSATLLLLLTFLFLGKPMIELYRQFVGNAIVLFEIIEEEEELEEDLEKKSKEIFRDKKNTLLSTNYSYSIFYPFSLKKYIQLSLPPLLQPPLQS